MVGASFNLGEGISREVRTKRNPYWWLRRGIILSSISIVCIQRVFFSWGGIGILVGGWAGKSMGQCMGRCMVFLNHPTPHHHYPCTMHQTMHGPACLSTKIPIPPQLKNTRWLHTILLLSGQGCTFVSDDVPIKIIFHKKCLFCIACLSDGS